MDRKDCVEQLSATGKGEYNRADETLSEFVCTDLIVSIPDLCTLTYFDDFSEQKK